MRTSPGQCWFDLTVVDGPVTLRFYPEALTKQTFLKGRQGQGWGWGCFGDMFTHAHIRLMIVPQTNLESFLAVVDDNSSKTYVMWMFQLKGKKYI